MPIDIKPWPDKGQPGNFEDMVAAFCQLVNSAFILQRKPDAELTYHGHDIGRLTATHALPVSEALSPETIAYREANQGRDLLDQLLSVIVQVSIEQGRRSGLQQLHLQPIARITNMMAQTLASIVEDDT